MDLNSAAVIWAAVICAIAVTAILLARRGPRDMLPYLAAYFTFFGFGPVVNYLLGSYIYFGIRTNKIGLAAVGLLLALLGMLVVGLLVPIRPAVETSPLSATAVRDYPLVSLLLLGLAGYASSTFILAGPALLAGDKLDRIAAAGRWHYQFLLVEVIACSLYFLATRTSVGRIAYWTNMACYVAYCLATAERDFLFVLFTVLLHTQLRRRRSMPVQLVVVGAGLVMAASYLVELRGGAGMDATQILNQGTVLFVDTFVMERTPALIPHLHGQTYLAALLSLLPENLGTSPYTLSDWLVSTYTPGSNSGYGFSLTGEAYLNFGLPGIPVVFATLTLVQRFLVNRLDRDQIYPFASILFTICWMYGFRGESIALLRTLTYGAILYALIFLTSVRKRDPARQLSRWRRRRVPFAVTRL